MSTTTHSPLRQRMIEDMSLRNLAPRTQEAYIRGCRKLAAFLRRSPDTATAEDVRLFQLHLAEQRVSICTRNRTMTGVAFLFRVTLRRPEIADQIEYIAEPQKIPLVLSPEEVRRLLDAAPGFKYRLLLSLTYGCGLRASEVVSLRVCDIDSAQMVIRIEQGKGRKDRYVMLPPALLDMLRQWWKAARPQGWLFPGRPPVNPLTYRQLNRIFHLAAEAAEIRKGATLHTLRHRSSMQRAQPITPRHHRLRGQIAIERAATSVPHLPRLRALQVCRRRPLMRVASSVMAGIRKPLQGPTKLSCTNQLRCTPSSRRNAAPPRNVGPCQIRP